MKTDEETARLFFKQGYLSCLRTTQADYDDSKVEEEFKNFFGPISALETRLSIPENNEIEFLKFMVQKMTPCLGPADSEIIDSIKDQWVRKGRALPPGYGKDE